MNKGTGLLDCENVVWVGMLGHIFEAYYIIAFGIKRYVLFAQY